MLLTTFTLSSEILLHFSMLEGLASYCVSFSLSPKVFVSTNVLGKERFSEFSTFSQMFIQYFHHFTVKTSYSTDAY